MRLFVGTFEQDIVWVVQYLAKIDTSIERRNQRIGVKFAEHEVGNEVAVGNVELARAQKGGLAVNVQSRILDE